MRTIYTHHLPPEYCVPKGGGSPLCIKGARAQKIGLKSTDLKKVKI